MTSSQRRNPSAQQLVLNRHVTTVVTRYWDETPSIRSVELGDPHGWDLPAFNPGAHVDLIIDKDLVRQYSLSSAPYQRNRYQITVRRDPSSRGGSDFVHRLSVGDQLSVSLPKNMFALATTASRHLFIAGGIGLAPIMIHDQLAGARAAAFPFARLR